MRHHPFTLPFSVALGLLAAGALAADPAVPPPVDTSLYD